ncbi:aminoacyltransferase [Leucobacter coleopterorum]|uniref:Aminoacyltransferase n=1 Tax=Leucobacter coleopterorum TaxID=2714933 RepID=A0ABX6JUF1_9MICO|nr:peptidoglycan bridge formation glycyltransferase FemA/FemB family protein [Leucobacter coleopterorum]QIM17897.1 aminoacyltransferase [Leucobacter coleopterorum]
MKNLGISIDLFRLDGGIGGRTAHRQDSERGADNATHPLRFACEAEVSSWNSSIEALCSGGQVWQSREYAASKRFQHYVDRYVVGESFPATLVLERRVPLLGKWWYVPGGPDALDVESMLSAAERLANFARQHGVFLLKIEPRLLEDNATIARLAQRGFARGARILPNESTILLDISGDNSDVLGRFSSSTRTKIRKADKTGFQARRVAATEENCRIMYALLCETGEGRFQLRPYPYYRHFWQTFERSGRGQLVLGYADEEPVAGMFGTVFGRTSGYKDGASTRHLKLPSGLCTACSGN